MGNVKRREEKWNWAFIIDVVVAAAMRYENSEHKMIDLIFKVKFLIMNRMGDGEGERMRKRRTCLFCFYVSLTYVFVCLCAICCDWMWIWISENVPDDDRIWKNGRYYTLFSQFLFFFFLSSIRNTNSTLSDFTEY